ncbi:hypothetical protein E4634_16905 [Mangrovimicrobium sediminis]|uniref:Uncharacterized protein n=1 Tax=Mangrovimicrobium sediminis TaxID=2562682 RepID=A0A4Z0LX43_9GAMM|nr:hypothetical protein [Haliea sp. SAOS-164]TGD71794.1 hypothetical protein E4634_16905 [Haliea sp. SAOS-164]
MAFFDKETEEKTQVTGGRAFRHLFAFQVKLAADAVRDFVFSPLSILVFFLDAIRRPPIEESLYLKLMSWGRRTDRYINLFDEHREKGEHTMDEAIESFERIASQAGRPPAKAQDDEPPAR